MLDPDYSCEPILSVSPKAHVVAALQVCGNSINHGIVFSAASKASDRSTARTAGACLNNLLRIQPFAEINRAVRMGQISMDIIGFAGLPAYISGPASPNPKLEFTIHDPTWIEDGDETGHLHTGTV